MSNLVAGDWGLGIGPNPQSPIPNPHIRFNRNSYKVKYKIIIYLLINKYIQQHNNIYK